MTVEEFQRALRISNDQVRDLKSLTDAFVNFDKELAHASRGAHQLAAAAVESQLLVCEQLIAKLLGVTLKEAEELIGGLLGASSGPHIMTVSSLALSFIVAKANP